MSADAFYVTAINGSQRGFLAGPFDTLAEAEARVDDCRKLAEQIDRMAGFYAYGTAGIDSMAWADKIGRPLPTGRLNDRLMATP